MSVVLKEQIAIDVNVELLTFQKDIIYSSEFWGYARVWHNSPLAYYAKQVLEYATIDRLTIRNKVVDDGLLQINNLLMGVNTKSITHGGVGSGTTAPAAADHDLQTAIGSRHLINFRYPVGSTQSHYDVFYGDLENNGTWNEAGLFTGTAAYPTEYMLAHLLVNQPGGFTKDNTKTAVCAWTLTLASVN